MVQKQSVSDVLNSKSALTFPNSDLEFTQKQIHSTNLPNSDLDFAQNHTPTLPKSDLDFA